MTSILRILSILALLGFWLLLASVFPPTVVPGPVVVAGKIVENFRSGQAPYHLYKTLLRVFFGLILTMALGVTAGTIMGLFRKGEAFLDAWVTVGLTIPAIVYSIICLLWFGFNDTGAIVAIGVSAFPTVANANRNTCASIGERVEKGPDLLVHFGGGGHGLGDLLSQTIAIALA